MVYQNSYEILIALYLFLAGVGAGAILTAAALDLYNRDKFISYIKAASWLGAPLVGIGCGFLILDLGQGMTKPWLLIYLFCNPTSAITWGTAILTLFIIAAAVYALHNLQIINFRPICLPIVLIVLSVLTAGYTAVLLGSLKAIPFWNQTALPVLFLASATSSGMAASTILAHILYKDSGDDAGIITKFHLYLIVAKVVIVTGMMFIAFNGVPEMAYSAKTLLAGKFAPVFWVGFVVMGLGIPFYFTLRAVRGHALSLAEIFTAEGCSLIGGYLLRHLILHAGTYTDRFPM